MIKPSNAIFEATRSVCTETIGLSTPFWMTFGVFYRCQRLIWRISRTRKALQNVDHFSLGLGIGLNTLAGKKKGVQLFAQTLFIALAISECVENCLKIQQSMTHLKELFTGKYLFPIQHKWHPRNERSFFSPSSIDNLKYKSTRLSLTIKAVWSCLRCIIKSSWKLGNSMGDAAHMFSLNVQSDDFIKQDAILQIAYNGKKLWENVTENIPLLANRLEEQEMIIDKLFQQIGCQWQVMDVIKLCRTSKKLQTKFDHFVDDCNEEIFAFGRKLNTCWDSFITYFKKAEPPKKGTPHRRFIASYYLQPAPHYTKMYQKKHPLKKA